MSLFSRGLVVLLTVGTLAAGQLSTAVIAHADDADLQIVVDNPVRIMINREVHPPNESDVDPHCQYYPDPCQKQPAQWNQGDATGLCASPNFRRGGYPLSIQSIAWAHGDFTSPTDIDGYAGSRTDTAIRSWQRAHRLTEDGCAGYATWSMAQDGGDRVYDPSCNCTDTYPHMIFLGQVDATSLYRFEEANTDRFVKYEIFYEAHYFECVLVTRPGGTKVQYTVVEYAFTDRCTF